ncbi:MULTISPECIES: Na+/H+ antiporter NhaA [Desulfosediminicola]|uniref:Na+/H+ antiporter NhaA n=1 Tax=Desulfosediminicola TaxID=2886823 RepID=UPI0010AC44D0|nr:Na+/H+ antiporter NhaA [Desulfosediminicola ganghwensis]
MINEKDSFISKFFKLESAGGLTLMFAAALAVILANSPLKIYYDMLLGTPVQVRIGALDIAKPLLLWINDGLMAVFFFLVGLELKREVLEGELADKRNIILPGIGAIGGMAIPALVYIFFNSGDPVAMKGWAIPAATDIAFALGVLSLLGSRVPIALKVFLTSLAIFDDVGAILIIALFYTSELSIAALVAVALCLPILYVLNKRGVASKSPYLIIGIILWTCMLKSGVHATLAGVLMAMFIPLRDKTNPESSPLKELEHDLHTTVAFLVLPVFAFANAGISVSGMTAEHLLHGVPVGVALGLFFGKQIGVFGFCWAAIKMGWADMPKGMNFKSLYATAALCGIGFTMSLFIGSLAFEGAADMALVFDERLGIIIGSLASGIFGYLLLKSTLKDNEVQQ